MHILLRHPVHGKKIAISDMEVEADKEHGWVVVDDDKPAEAQVNELEVRRRRRQSAA